MNLNPVFVNELRQSIFRRKPLIGLALWASITGFLMWLSQFTGSLTGATMLPLFIMPIIIPALAAGVFAKEYEQQTWQDLYLTRLTNFQVVTGKFSAALLLSYGIALSFLPAMQLSLAWQGQWWALTPGWWMLALAFKLFVSVCLYVLIVMVCSRYSATRRVALVWSYIALFLYAMINMAVWSSVGEMAARADIGSATYNNYYGNSYSAQSQVDPMGPGFMQGIHFIFCTVVGGGAVLLLWVSLSEQRGYKSAEGVETRRAWQPIAQTRQR